MGHYTSTPFLLGEKGVVNAPSCDRVPAIAWLSLRAVTGIEDDGVLHSGPCRAAGNLEVTTGTISAVGLRLLPRRKGRNIDNLSRNPELSHEELAVGIV